MSAVKKWLREPLLHFLLIGSALFLLFAWRDGWPSARGGAGSLSSEVVVTRDDIAQMVALFEKTWRRPPTVEEQQGLIDDFVRNEIYYREAIAMGLDRDDDVVKRRLRLKMEFIFEDIGSIAEPTDADLGAFMTAHQARYLTEPAFAFRQVFVNVSSRGAAADVHARELLARLTAGANPGSVGDPTLLPASNPLSPLGDIEAQFGAEFGRALVAAPMGAWTGPIRSGFGLHLVYVQQSTAGQLPALQEVHDAVRRDWLVAQQKSLQDAAYARMKERYIVTVEGREP